MLITFPGTSPPDITGHLSRQTDQKIKCLPVEKAGELSGSNPDYSIQDLYNAIAEGNFPTWTFYVQIMTFEEAENCSFNPFDLTKVTAGESPAHGHFDLIRLWDSWPFLGSWYGACEYV